MTDEKMFDQVREQSKELHSEFYTWMEAQGLFIRSIHMHFSTAVI